jgi:hypothetical protein
MAFDDAAVMLTSARQPGARVNQLSDPIVACSVSMSTSTTGSLWRPSIR